MKRLHKAFICALILASLTASSAFASKLYTPIETNVEDMELIDVGVIEEILRSDQIVLEGGKTYKLDGIRVPIYEDSYVQNFLQENYVGKIAGIYVNPTIKKGRIDKYGIPLVHVLTADHVWIQGDMVSRGLAWAECGADNRDLMKPLLQNEEAARKKKRGLWRNPRYAIKTESTVSEMLPGSFDIYQGHVRAVKTKEGFLYWNFGEDPQTDFTFVINLANIVPALRPVPSAEPLMRIRGWVEDNSGPMIRFVCEEQWEVLPPPKLKTKTTTP